MTPEGTHPVSENERHTDVEGAMIEVPLEAFALLWAYCFTGQLDVPAHIRAHPNYPAKRDHRRGHLTKALAPYAEKAFALLTKAGAPS